MSKKRRVSIGGVARSLASSAMMRTFALRVCVLSCALCVNSACFVSYSGQSGVRVDSRGDASIIARATWESGPGGNRKQRVRGEGYQERDAILYTAYPRVDLAGGLNMMTRRPELHYNLGFNFNRLWSLAPSSTMGSLGLGLNMMTAWDEQWRARFGFGPGITINWSKLTRRLEGGDYGFATRGLYLRFSALGRKQGWEAERNNPWMYGVEIGGNLRRFFVDEIYTTRDRSQNDECAPESC